MLTPATRCAAITLLTTSPLVAEPPHYVTRELTSYPGAPPNFPGYTAVALAPRGVVAGFVSTSGLLWTPTGTIELGSLGSGVTFPYAVNSSNQVVGSSYTGALRHAFLWSSGSMQDLGTLGGNLSFATSISESGEVVGGAKTAEAFFHAFSWRQGTMTDLGVLPGDAESSAIAVNAAGQIIGISSDEADVPHAFLYEHGSMTDLGLPPWSPPGWRIEVTDINAGGAIVGVMRNPKGLDGIPYVRSDRRWQPLPHGDSTFVRVDAINSRGDIVGASAPRSAVLWTNGREYNINRLLAHPFDGVLTEALDINDDGQILARSLWLGPKYSLFRYYLLTPQAPATAAP